MCGRTGLSLKRDDIQCACSYKPTGTDTYKKPDWVDEYNDGKQYSPSYNIAPTDVTPVLVSSNNFRVNAGTERILKPMMWGMIPPWKDDHNLSTNNCRLENINTSKLYYPALKDGGRCVIVVEGFYEWQTTNKSTKVKQPYYIYAEQSTDIQMDDPITWSNNYTERNGWSGVKLLHIAGIYNKWQNEIKTVYSYSVITMNSNSTFDWLHHRMPAILETQEQIDAWLDIDNIQPDRALSYLKPASILKWHPVSIKVNNSRYKSSDCNHRILEKERLATSQRTLTSWFSKVNKRKTTDQCPSNAKRNKE